MAEKLKTASPAQAKRMKIIFWSIIIFIGALLATLVTIMIVKRRKQKSLLDNETKKDAGTEKIKAPSADDYAKPGDGLPLDLGSKGPNVLAVQKAINKNYPEAKLQEDGDLGPLTRAAILKYYGQDSIPVTESVLQKIITSRSSIGYQNPAKQDKGDDFPLTKGSSGKTVQALKRMINIIYPAAKLDDSNLSFDDKTYDALITGVGTKYYPVTFENYKSINNIYNTKTGNLNPLNAAIDAIDKAMDFVRAPFDYGFKNPYDPEQFIPKPFLSSSVPRKGDRHPKYPEFFWNGMRWQESYFNNFKAGSSIKSNSGSSFSASTTPKKGDRHPKYPEFFWNGMRWQESYFNNFKTSNPLAILNPFASASTVPKKGDRHPKYPDYFWNGLHWQQA